MAQNKIDDRYTEGVYYDETVSEFFEFERSEDGTSVELVSVESGGVVETVDAEEFHVIQQYLSPVPEEVIENPVAYMVNFVNGQLARSDFDTGLIYADRMTEVVESEE